MLLDGSSVPGTLVQGMPSISSLRLAAEHLASRYKGVLLPASREQLAACLSNLRLSQNQKKKKSCESLLVHKSLTL